MAKKQVNIRREQRRKIGSNGGEVVYKSYKFRLYPNVNQIRELEIMLETHRRLYNECLVQRKSAYDTEKRTVTCTEQNLWFTQEKKTNPYYQRLNHTSAYGTTRKVDKAFYAFYRRIRSGETPGYPRHKSRWKFHSFSFPTYGDGIKLRENDKLYIQFVGVIRCKVHRPIDGFIISASIKREGEKWFVSFRCIKEEAAILESMLPSVGIDLGLTSFLTTSDGEIVENPRYLKKALPELAKAHRAVSRKKKGGSNRRKAWKKVKKIYLKVRNQRNDYQHKIALDLIRCYGLIAVESLDIKRMNKNRRFSQAISDASWGNFVEILQYKAERAGVVVAKVLSRGTSQQCSNCWEEVPKSFYVQQHNCSHCGLSLQRDENAARNILARALQVWSRPVGVNTGGCVAQEAT